jgi:hypothetical protein
MFVIDQFGAATEAIQAATVDGSLRSGVQFIGQLQGMINVSEARDVLQRQANCFEAGIDDHDLDARASGSIP